jgi:hypothetical protein
MPEAGRIHWPDHNPNSTMAAALGSRAHAHGVRAGSRIVSPAGQQPARLCCVQAAPSSSVCAAPAPRTWQLQQQWPSQRVVLRRELPLPLPCSVVAHGQLVRCCLCVTPPACAPPLAGAQAASAATDLLELTEENVEKVLDEVRGGRAWGGGLAWRNAPAAASACGVPAACV